MTAFLNRYPYFALCMAGGALVDALNCVRMGHDDWYFPAFIALAIGMCVEGRA